MLEEARSTPETESVHSRLADPHECKLCCSCAPCNCSCACAHGGESVYDDGERRCEDFETVAYDIPRGCAAGYFPEMNPLVSRRSVAKVSGTPTSKWIPVRLEPAQGALGTQIAS